MAAPAAAGVIDTAIHNQRIAILDISTEEVRQVSPLDLHIYDFDWSPDDQTFVATAAPGPGDNNWWIAQLYTIDIAKGNATSIYKPSLQMAVPRWSPDGKSVETNQLLATAPQQPEVLDQGFEPDAVQPTGRGIDQQRRADLHDHAPRLLQRPGFPTPRSAPRFRHTSSLPYPCIP